MSVIEPKPIHDDCYKTVTGFGESSYKDRGSKFIGLVYHVEKEEEIQDILNTLKKQYYDARHICYAWILDPENPAYRINDDGEPANSAGTPIYHQLLSNELYNVIGIVIRYFGGTKLGVPGLINAYKTATEETLQLSKVEEKFITCTLKIDFPYSLMNDVMRVIKNLNLEITKEDMGLRGGYYLRFRKKLKEEVENQFTLLHELNFQYF